MMMLWLILLPIFLLGCEQPTVEKIVMEEQTEVTEVQEVPEIEKPVVPVVVCKPLEGNAWFYDPKQNKLTDLNYVAIELSKDAELVDFFTQNGTAYITLSKNEENALDGTQKVVLYYFNGKGESLTSIPTKSLSSKGIDFKDFIVREAEYEGVKYWDIVFKDMKEYVGYDYIRVQEVYMAVPIDGELLVYGKWLDRTAVYLTDHNVKTGSRKLQKQNAVELWCL